jgi:Tfp pilus assembly protein PilZ
VRFEGSADAARAIKAYSVNLSVGGLCLKVQRAYEVGHPLELTLDVDGKEFKVEGVVAWTRKGVIGVRFGQIDEATRVALSRILESESRRAPPAAAP